MAAYTGTGALVVSKAVIAAVTYVPATGTWDADDREWGSAEAVYSEARPVMLVGNEFYQADKGINFGGTPIRVVLGRTGLTIFGRSRDGQWKIAPNLIKQISNVYPIIRGTSGTVIFVSAGGQESPDDPIAWEGPREFRVGIDSFIDFTVSGRYLAIRFESVDQNPWEMLSYDLDLEVIGGR